MKRTNLRKKLKKIGLTAFTSLASLLILGANAYSVVASAEEETPKNAVTIGVTLKETKDVYSIELTKEEGEYVVACEDDETFVYTLNQTDEALTMEFAGLATQGEWTYEMTYVVYENSETENCESVLSVTKGADLVDVEISLGSAIVDYDAYLEGEEKTDLSATLSNGGKTLTVNSEEEKAVAASDVMTVKIIIPDTLLVEDFQNTLEVAEEKLIPKIYLIVAAILLVALVIVGFAMLFVAG